MKCSAVALVLLGAVGGCTREVREQEQGEGLVLLCGQGRLGESGRYLCCTFYNPSDAPQTFGWWDQIDYSAITLRSTGGILWVPSPRQYKKHTVGAHTLKEGESRTFLVDLTDGKFSGDFKKATFTVEYSCPKHVGYDLRKKQGWVLHATSPPFEIERWRVDYREPQ